MRITLRGGGGGGGGVWWGGGGGGAPEPGGWCVCVCVCVVAWSARVGSTDDAGVWGQG